MSSLILRWNSDSWKATSCSHHFLKNLDVHPFIIEKTNLTHPKQVYSAKELLNTWVLVARSSGFCHEPFCPGKYAEASGADWG